MVRARMFLPFAFCLFTFSLRATETNLVSGPVLFDRDVRPIFEQSCFRCHGPEKPKSDFRLDLRSEALKGGEDNTNDIVPGHSDQSKLIRYVAGQDKDIQMPPPDTSPPLTPAQIAVLRAWIDEGVAWSTNGEPALALSVSPMLRWTDVSGDNKKFRELEGVREGFGGGAQEFSWSQQLAPDEKLTMEGHALVPENDFKLVLALDKNNVGFIHGGFEEWRKYFDDTGGYYPGFTPSTYSLGSDLHQDIGRAWVDLGLTLPDWPLLVFGYEYQFRQGTQSMLDWGTVYQAGNAKNIYPNAEDVNEHTHIFKVDITDEFDGWAVENHGRVEVYRLGENRDEVTAFSTGPLPDTREVINQSVHYTVGANTFRVEKQITDWWLASAGSLLSRFDGNSRFTQNAQNGTGTPTFGTYWGAQNITLKRTSRVASLGTMFLPVKGLSLSAAAQGEWTSENGFGTVNLGSGDPAIPGFYFPFSGPVNADQDRTEYSESVDAKFSRLPRTVVFANARLRQQSVDQSDSGFTDPNFPFQQQTDAINHFYDAVAGFTTSPWAKTELGAHVRQRDSSTGYGNSVVPIGYAYPGFITHRDITMNEIEGWLVLRPAYWLSARLTYDWDKSDFSTTTTAAAGITPGGPITDGRTVSDIFGLNLTFTPVPRFYFSGSFTYGYSSTRTLQAAAPEVVPYFGNTWTVGASVGYALNAKTELNATYSFSQATYGQNNTAGIPLGLDFTRHELLAGLTRQITKRLSGGLHYQFSEYSEPSTGNVNNFTAHGVFATFTYKWP